MKRSFRRAIEITLGVIMVITGAFMGIFPFLPGFLIGVPGILLISPAHGKKLIKSIKNAAFAVKDGEFKRAWHELWKFLPRKDRIALALKKYWRKVKKADKNKAWWHHPEKEVIRIAKKLRQGRVLDVGSGMGRHTLFLAQNGFEVWSFDFTEQAIEQTKAKLACRGLSAKVFTADFRDFDYGENEFDLILSMNVIHHAEKQEVERVCHNIVRGLKKGGYFLAFLPAMRSIKANEKLVAKQTVIPTSGPEKNIPHFLFSKKDLKELFKGCKLKLKKLPAKKFPEEHFRVLVKKG
jgi:2-polyprenyl-3-methyl-5-hydroxy-6-metoxy-1,4-benzoquinol methylase